MLDSPSLIETPYFFSRPASFWKSIGRLDPGKTSTPSEEAGMSRWTVTCLPSKARRSDRSSWARRHGVWTTTIAATTAERRKQGGILGSEDGKIKGMGCG